MNREELCDKIWEDLPSLRKWLVGKDRVDALVSLAVEQCPIEILSHVQGRPESHEVVVFAWKSAVKRRYCIQHEEDGAQFGPLFWIIVSPILQCIVTRLLAWGLEANSHKLLIAGWKKELTA
jgi:hypothetical protein